MSSDDDRERPPLNRDRVLRAAVELADTDGLGALTMRRLGAELGVEAMSLYKHVANKDEILDGIVEVVMGEIDTPDPDEPWKEAMRRRANSARQVLRRHSWAVGLMETRPVHGPVVSRYADSIIGNLRSAGFSIIDAGHAFTMLDSYVYGHVIQEAGSTVADDPAATTAEGAQEDVSEYPNLAEMYEHADQFSFDAVFDYGLDLVLNALERTALGVQ